MARRLSLLLLLCPLLSFAAGPRPPIVPYEIPEWTIPETQLDGVVKSSLAREGVDFRHSCSDAVFLRRVYLDLIGALPEPEEIAAFEADTGPNRVSRLVDKLFTRSEFADYQSMRWCDLLRVKSEFPINLWPNAVQAYHRWIRDAVATNMRYDVFARALLLGGGSSFRDPPSNFYRALESRTPAGIAGTVSATFLGIRPEALGEAGIRGLAPFFERVGYKKTLEWKEEVVYLKDAPGETEATLPDGTRVRLKGDSDPRARFADWLTGAGKRYLARAAVNRAWTHFMGTSLSTETPSAGAEPADYLTSLLIDSGWDTRALYRAIVESRTYRQSSLSSGGGTETKSAFAFYRIRRLEAEVLADALARIGPQAEQYYSAVPEPFTFIPLGNRTTALADGSITSSFLVKFGRPSRDTGTADERDNTVSSEQLLHLLNSTDLRRRLENGPLVKKVLDESGGDRVKGINLVYRLLLSRFPEPWEFKEIAARLGKTGTRQVFIEVAWVIVNGKEFLYRH